MLICSHQQSLSGSEKRMNELSSLDSGKTNPTSCFQIGGDPLLSPESMWIKCGLNMLNINQHPLKKKEEMLTETKVSNGHGILNYPMDNR